jgi:hypothetical protein
MALIWVQHDISGVILELDEVQLAHPVLGPHYKPVRVNPENGKVYVLKPDADAEKKEDK